MRVLVTGGRDFQDRQWLWDGLDLIHAKQPIAEIIEGGAEGADRRAQTWAHRRGVRCTTVPADWARYGRAAGYRRNAEMADMNPDMVLACPGGRGTAMMIDIARRRGIPVALLKRMPVAPSTPQSPPETVIDAYSVDSSDR